MLIRIIWDKLVKGFVVKVSILFFCILALPSISNAIQYTDGATYRQNFETVALGYSWFGNRLNVKSYTTGGIQGKIVQAINVPSIQGTERINKAFYFNDYNSLNSATLSFDVKLHSAFEFVKGGKMHGLAGGTATTGCKPIDPNGWSVRMMWRPNGEPVLYIYHQDRVAACGDTYLPLTNFTFSKGAWYRIDLYVKMNSGIRTSDGRASLYIDDELIVDVQGLNLSGNGITKIDKFLFSVFYGGNDPSWSPSTTTYLYFDNFTVHQGLKITGDLGTTCEIFDEGVYRSSNHVCCAEGCGSCGGTGCSDLPGGHTQCCPSTILNSSAHCSSPGTKAPCFY